MHIQIAKSFCYILPKRIVFALPNFQSLMTAKISVDMLLTPVTKYKRTIYNTYDDENIIIYQQI